MSSKETYRKLCPADAPLFHQPFWLDAVAENDWDAAVIKTNNLMEAYYLYAVKNSPFGTVTYMPEFTQFLGPGYKLDNLNERQRLNRETELLEKLCSMLPETGSFLSRWQTGYFNWLPFHWAGYSQRVRYTYVLDNLSKPDELLENFNEKVRREIRKAAKTFSIKETENTTRFYELIKNNLGSKKARVQLSFDILKSAYLACKKQGCGKIWCATDQNEAWGAAIFVAWDTQNAYYIIGAKDNKFGNSGAMSYLFWMAFQELRSSVSSFDFEGSMIKGVENYFRSFGSAQRMFFEISRTKSPLVKLKNAVKEFRK